MSIYDTFRREIKGMKKKKKKKTVNASHPGKKIADDLLKYFSYLSLKKGLDIVETICMKCQILFLKKKKVSSICRLMNYPREW